MSWVCRSEEEAIGLHVDVDFHPPDPPLDDVFTMEVKVLYVHRICFANPAGPQSFHMPNQVSEPVAISLELWLESYGLNVCGVLVALVQLHQIKKHIAGYGNSNRALN